MKRLLLVLLCVLPTLLLCSCAADGISAEANEYLISAMGLDAVGDSVSLCFEAIIVNSEDTDAEKRVELIKGEGTTVAEAAENAAARTVHPLMLSHLGVAVIGTGVSSELFDQLCRYCYDSDEINLSVSFAETENAEKLLSCEAVSSIAVGYDILSMLDRQGKRTGIEYMNRFYEVKAAGEKPIYVTALPFFETDSGRFSCEGLMLRREGEPLLRLDGRQAFFYSLATNTQCGGNFISDGKRYTLNSARTSVCFSGENFITAELKIKLKYKGEALSEEKVSQGIYELFELSKKLKSDFFGLGNIIYSRDRRLWDEIKRNYEEVYNFNLTVESD